MKRRTFFKGTAVGAAAAAAPAIWSEAKAQARNETLLIVGESPPNSMDIHGVGANRPAYEVSWNTHDRLMTYGVKKDANGNDHYDYTKLEPELATEWDLKPNSVTFKLRQRRQVPRRHAGHRQGREVVVRPRRHGGRLPDLPDGGGLAAEARAVRGGRRPHLPRRLHPRRQAHHARHRRAGAGDHELRALQEERDRGRPVGHGMVQEQPCLGRRLQGRALAAGAGSRLRAQRRLEERADAQDPARHHAHHPVGRQPARPARARRRRHLVRPAVEGFLRAEVVAQAHRDRHADRERDDVSRHERQPEAVRQRQGAPGRGLCRALPADHGRGDVRPGASRCSAAPTTSSRASTGRRRTATRPTSPRPRR